MFFIGRLSATLLYLRNVLYWPIECYFVVP